MEDVDRTIDMRNVVHTVDRYLDLAQDPVVGHGLARHRTPHARIRKVKVYPVLNRQ